VVRICRSVLVLPSEYFDSRISDATPATKLTENIYQRRPAEENRFLFGRLPIKMHELPPPSFAYFKYSFAAAFPRPRNLADQRVIITHFSGADVGNVTSHPPWSWSSALKEIYIFITYVKCAFYKLKFSLEVSLSLSHHFSLLFKQQSGGIRKCLLLIVYR